MSNEKKGAQLTGIRWHRSTSPWSSKAPQMRTIRCGLSGCLDRLPFRKVSQGKESKKKYTYPALTWLVMSSSYTSPVLRGDEEGMMEKWEKRDKINRKKICTPWGGRRRSRGGRDGERFRHGGRNAPRCVCVCIWCCFKYYLSAVVYYLLFIHTHAYTHTLSALSCSSWWGLLGVGIFSFKLETRSHRFSLFRILMIY